MVSNKYPYFPLLVISILEKLLRTSTGTFIKKASTIEPQSPSFIEVFNKRFTSFLRNYK
jgi:hypothetical protein